MLNCLTDETCQQIWLVWSCLCTMYSLIEVKMVPPSESSYMTSIFTAQLQHAKLIQTSISVSIIMRETPPIDRYLYAWFAGSHKSHISLSVYKGFSKIYIGSNNTDWAICLHALHGIINALHIFCHPIGHTDNWRKVLFQEVRSWMSTFKAAILMQLQNFYYF